MTGEEHHMRTETEKSSASLGWICQSCVAQAAFDLILYKD